MNKCLNPTLNLYSVPKSRAFQDILLFVFLSPSFFAEVWLRRISASKRHADHTLYVNDGVFRNLGSVTSHKDEERVANAPGKDKLTNSSCQL